MKRENLEKITRHYYLGLTSRIEEETLFEEIKNNAESLTFFRGFEMEYAKHYLNSAGTKKQWKDFHSRYINKVNIRRRRFLNTLSRYAAVVGVAIVLATGFTLLDKWLKINQPEEWYETYVPRGEKAILTLPDGTKIWLNAETTLKYPATQLKDKRIVSLSGEGFFKVAKNEDVPFVVKTENYDVVVKGTSFNIMTYEDFDRSETALLSGSIEIENIIGKSSDKTVKLKPGQKIVFHKAEHNFSIVDANLEREAAWKDNLFIFKDIKFEELCRRLERWYDVDISLADPELKEIRYNGNFRNEETIWQVLDIIQITTPIRYELKNRKLIIYKE
jgi:ferric-dicitrate binding protein FerR (iron transport regulator)